MHLKNDQLVQVTRLFEEQLSIRKLKKKGGQEYDPFEDDELIPQYSKLYVNIDRLKFDKVLLPKNKYLSKYHVLPMHLTLIQEA